MNTLIDPEATIAKFGYHPDAAQLRDKVVVLCPLCGKSRSIRKDTALKVSSCNLCAGDIRTRQSAKNNGPQGKQYAKHIQEHHIERLSYKCKMCDTPILIEGYCDKHARKVQELLRRIGRNG